MRIAFSGPLILIAASLGGWLVLRSGYLGLIAATVPAPAPFVLPPEIAPWPLPLSESGVGLDQIAAMQPPLRRGVITSPAGTMAARTHWAGMQDRPALPALPAVSGGAFWPGSTAGEAPAAPAENGVLHGNRLLLQRMMSFRPGGGGGGDRAGLLSAVVHPAGALENFPPARAAQTHRWNLSAWLMARPGGGAATLGRAEGRAGLGGSQAGVRLSWRPAGGSVTGFARANSAGRLGDGGELAIGAALRPVRTLPVDLTVERRVSVTGPGRDAFAAYASGGGTAMLPGNGWRIDGYGAGGVVGARRRDMFGEGALRVDRPVAHVGALTLRAGGGLWAAAQPGVSRVDAGPTLHAQPTHRGAASISVDWRQRVSGDAAPGSGPAMTVALQF